MQFDFDNVKTTVREHPAETIAVVTTVGLLGVLFYQHRQKKAYELELATYRSMRPTVWSRFRGRRRPNRYVLDFAA